MVSIAVFIYWPGLQGGFLFDDENSLRYLSIINGELSNENMKAYLGASHSGILKRPISMLSFLIDANNWPAKAWSFKVTNLIIHIINGCFLYLLLSKIFSLNSSNCRYNYIALLSTSLWLLHPFFVSTVLYIVQRMAMLPTTFTLIGLYAYLTARIKYEKSQTTYAVLFMFLSISIATILATFSKENGVLFIFYTAIFEQLICLRFLQFKPLSLKVKMIIIKIPMFLIISVLILGVFPSYKVGYEFRDFTLSERLLSETRAICKYLYHLFIPDYFSEGIYTDGFIKSVSILNPISTLFSIIFLIFISIFAYIKRNKLPIVSFSIAFFLIANLIESTILPLELYFEHRSYLASLFVFVPVSIFLLRLSRKSKVFTLLPIFIMLFLIFTLFMRTNIWSNTDVMKLSSMELFPQSERARNDSAVYLSSLGKDRQAIQLLDQGIEIFDSLEYKANSLSAKCRRHEVNSNEVESLIKNIKTGKKTRNNMKSLVYMMFNLIHESCNLQDSIILYHKMYNAFNQKFGNQNYGKNFTFLLKAEYYFSVEEYDSSKIYHMKRLLSSHKYQNYFVIIKKYINKGQFRVANELIEYGIKDYNNRPFYFIDWFNTKNKFSKLRHEIKLKL